MIRKALPLVPLTLLVLIASCTPCPALPPSPIEMPTIAPSSRDVEGWAVLVSKEDYEDTQRPTTSNIPSAFLDLTQLRFLLEYYGWQPSHILEIRDTVTVESITTAMDWLIQNADADDVVFFYIFAHGGFLEDDLGWSNWFPDLWEGVESDRRVLVVSACQASLFTGAVASDPEPQVIIASNRDDEYGWGGIWEEGLPVLGSVFTHYFVDAFTDPSADLDGDWTISFQEAASYSNDHQRDYMHATIYRIPYYASSLGPQVQDANSPHVIVQDTAGEPILLDLEAYLHLPILNARRAWMSAQQWQIVGYTTEGTLSIALDGSKLAYVGPSGDIYVVDLPSMSQTASIATAASVIRRLAWSSDSTRLAGIEADHLWVWGMAEISLDLPGMDLRGLSWSPDDRFLAVASAQPSLLVLDTTTWAQTSTLELSPEVPPADDIAWAPSGQLLAGRGGDRVWIWDMTTGEVVMDEECEAAADIAWSPDAGLLAAPCDGIIHVWRVNEGYQDHDVPLYYWARIDDVSWSPDSNRLAAGTSDGLTMIWDVSGGEILGRMRDFVGSTDTIAWSTGGPSGEFLISASAADGLVLIRAVP